VSGEFEIWVLRYQLGPEHQLHHAAVWASSRIDSEAVLRSAVPSLTAHAPKLIEAVPLAAFDGAGALTPQDDWDLPGDLHWQVSTHRPFYAIPEKVDEGGNLRHHVARLGFAAPLDAQLGAWPQLNVPAELEPELFPQDGRHCHAILDGAVVPGLLDLIEASGLAHACLYQGPLAENSAELAPWIVTLRSDAPFTRRLFTASDQPSSLWGLDYGCFVSTRHSLAETRAHFRKFTSVEMASGKRVFLRFWSAPVLSAMARHGRYHGLIDSFLAPGRVIFRDLARIGAPRVFALSRGKAA